MSSHLTITPAYPLGPPLIGALLRMPFEAVLERMLAGLHEDGFTDLNAAHLPLLRYPGPENRRPSDLAGELRTTKQAMNYLLGELERRGYLTRQTTPRTAVPSASTSPSGDMRSRGRSAGPSARSRPSGRRSSARRGSPSFASS